jgi:hypothetical protein
MVDKALALGTGELLTPGERCLMAALLAHLDISATSDGQTSVWPGAARLTRLLGIGESTLRRLKSALEEKGFLLRRYDRRNRPLADDAIDLKPFLLRVPALLASIGHTENEIRTYRSEKRAEWCERAETEMSAQAPGVERPIRNLPSQTFVRTVIDEKEELAQSPMSDEAAMAVRLHPSLTGENAQSPDSLAGSLFGEERGGRLLAWARRRHGEKAILALAIAAQDDRLRDKAGWFAWFATTAETPDLTANAEALLKRRRGETGGPAISVSVPKEPLHARFFEAFEAKAGRASLSSYLSNATLSGAAGGALDISLPTRLAERRLKERFLSAITEAALEAGFTAITISGPRRE